MTVPDLPLLILGASARAAAWSARLGGLAPIAADLFADQDLVRIAQVIRLRGPAYRSGFLRAACDAPRCPWIYTGALENHPTLVHRIAKTRPLWGNAADVLRVVRDPFRLADCMARAGLPHLACRRDDSGLPRDGSWLVKPRRGAGGRGICHLFDDVKSLAEPATIYLQRHVLGSSVSAVFVATSGRAVRIGTTRQLVGDSNFHARGYHYCGNIGPIELDRTLTDQFDAIGELLAREFHLQGLFGIDAIVANDRVWLVEVNPRYTASCEILEHAMEISAIDWHHRACIAGELPQRPPVSNQTGRVWGKAVLFAPRTTVTRHMESQLAARCTCRVDCLRTQIADVPADGSVIEAGHPILTVFAHANDEFACHVKLVERARGVERDWS